MKFVFNLLGIILILAICWLISWNRKNIKWKTVAKALILVQDINKNPVFQKLIQYIKKGLYKQPLFYKKKGAVNNEHICNY